MESGGHVASRWDIICNTYLHFDANIPSTNKARSRCPPRLRRTLSNARSPQFKLTSSIYT